MAVVLLSVIADRSAYTYTNRSTRNVQYINESLATAMLCYPSDCSVSLRLDPEAATFSAQWSSPSATTASPLRLASMFSLRARSANNQYVH